MRCTVHDHDSTAPARRRSDFEFAEALERDKLLANNLNTGLVISVVNGVVLGLFLFPKSEPVVILSWFSVILATNLVRCVFARRVTASAQVLRPADLGWIVAMTAISGICWGLSPYLIFEPATRAEHFAIFMVAGMTAAASLSYATHLRIVAAFNFPALSTLLVFYFMIGGQTEYAMCAVLVLYFVGTIVIARRSGETVTKAISNKYLAEQQRIEIESKSEALNREIEAHTQSEIQLKNALSHNRQFNEALDALYQTYVLTDQSTDRLTKEATECVSRVLGLERVSIWTFSDDDDILVCENLFEASKNAHSVGATIEERDYPAYFSALRDSRVISVENAETDPRTSCFTESYLRPANIKSMLDAPLRAGRGLCGVICCETVGAQRAWTIDEIAFVTAVAQFISMSLFSDDARSLARKLQTALADAEHANDAKSAFLATMSHEIRTPMNGVLGATALLQKKELEPESSGYVDIIRDCGNSLMDVLNDILDVSKLEAGKIEIEQSDFSIREIVGSIHSIYNLKAQEKGLRFETSVAQDVMDLRSGDAHRIRQILHNLVSNSMKFTERGDVVVLIANSKTDITSEPTINISVADTGIGMSGEQTENIFETFVQADSSMTRRYGGSGLGLSIVKGIVDAMGGVICVNSRRGKGTIFEIDIPLPILAETTVEPEAAPVARKIAWEDMSILVAEDNAINRMIIDAFLKQTGAQVSYFENGRLAVEAVKDRQFDVALMDIHMPEMDGVQALLDIRTIEMSENRRALPIIAVTADAMQQEVRRYLELGFNEHLPKPINEDDLIQAIEKTLNINSAKTAAA